MLSPTLSGRPPVYVLLHVPKCAGQTLSRHLAAHMRPETLGIAGGRTQARALLRTLTCEPEAALAMRALTGHSISVAHERALGDAPLRRTILLRDPVGQFISLYNLQSARYVLRGQAPLTPEQSFAALPQNPIATLILRHYLGYPWPQLAVMSLPAQACIVNQALASFWFVGAYRECGRLLAAIAPDLGIPPEAPPHNTAQDWHARAHHPLLTAQSLAPALRARILVQNQLDAYLFETWAPLAGAPPAEFVPPPFQVRPGAPSFVQIEAGRLFGSWQRKLQRNAPLEPVFVRKKTLR